MISIRENDKPPLTHTPMIVDGGINETLNKYEVLSYLNCHSTNLLIGKPRSGKSSLLYSLFNSKHALKKTYHFIACFIPSSSRSSIKTDIFENLPKDQQFDELTIGNLASVYEMIKQLPKSQNKCLIFDDMSAYLKDAELQKLFKEIVFNRRHNGISIYCLSQSFLAVPRELRRVFSNLFIFKVPVDTMRTIFSELIEQKEDLVIPIMKEVYDKLFSFLFINLDTQRMYKNWDEIILS